MKVYILLQHEYEYGPWTTTVFKVYATAELATEAQHHYTSINKHPNDIEYSIVQRLVRTHNEKS